MSATGHKPTWPEQARSVSSRIPMAVLIASEVHNIDTEDVLRTLTLRSSVLRQEDERVSVQDEQAIWRECGERLGKPLRGLDVLRSVPPGFFGLPEMLFATAATFGEAVQIAIEFMPLLRHGLSLHAVHHGDVMELTYIFDEPLHLLEPGSVELLIGAVLAHGANCIGYAPEVRQLCLPPGALADADSRDALVQAYGTEDIVSDAVRPRIDFPLSVLSLPQRSSAPRLHGILRAHALEVLLEHSGEAQFILRVRRMLLLDLERGEVSLDGVARQLHMSKRSLQRRLSERGTSFAEQRDELRKTLAEQYLQDNRIQLAEVSFRLGYGSSQAFHRAFHGWFGCSPNAWRLRREGPHDSLAAKGKEGG